MADDESDMHVTIPVRPVFDELCCPICFNTLSECKMTPCGHNFCAPCILECLNRKHSCPCCNADTLASSLISNHHFDRLIAVVEEQKASASKAYYDKLIGGAPQAPPTLTSSGNVVAADAAERSPIEALFAKHMKRSLGAYEEYYQDLRQKFERACQRVRDEACEEMAKREAKFEKKIRKIEKGQGEGSVVEEKRKHDKKMLKIRQRCDERLEELNQSLDESVQLLISGYDTYMQDFAPTPAYLPVNVSLVIASKKITIPSVRLSTTDSVKDLRRMVRELMDQRGDPFQKDFEFSASNVFVLRRVFAVGGAEMDGACPDDILLGDEHRPIVQYKVDPGSHIVLRGDVKLESDKPKMCFTATFQKGDAMDYYTCKTCSFNWVCKTCAECCHAGHELQPYIMNHKPSWSCCYCVKHRKCTITNSKTLKKTSSSASTSSSS